MPVNKNAISKRRRRRPTRQEDPHSVEIWGYQGCLITRCSGTPVEWLVNQFFVLR